MKKKKKEPSLPKKWAHLAPKKKKFASKPKRERRNPDGKTGAGIARKKQFGQHFLHKQSVVDNMIDRATVTDETTVMEIGCGSGFLTRSILQQTPCKALEIFEIDPEWANFVSENIRDERLSVNIINILDVDLNELKHKKPWVLLANLPYQITFPLFFLFRKHLDLFTEGIVMIQEEVAQKIVAQRGKPYSATSLFLQHVYDFELLEKVPAEAFSPPPKVLSRLLYFKPKRPEDIIAIPDEEKFWKFVRACFFAPRQTLRNNMKRVHYPVDKFPEKFLKMRAQQVSFKIFLEIWDLIRAS